MWAWGLNASKWQAHDMQGHIQCSRVQGCVLRSQAYAFAMGNLNAFRWPSKVKCDSEGWMTALSVHVTPEHLCRQQLLWQAAAHLEDEPHAASVDERRLTAIGGAIAPNSKAKGSLGVVKMRTPCVVACSTHIATCARAHKADTTLITIHNCILQTTRQTLWADMEMQSFGCQCCKQAVLRARRKTAGEGQVL